MANLTPELEIERKKINQYAKDAGLDCFETVFEMINYDQICQFAAYGGFPVRYPHWRFGMEYEHLAKSYEYGLSKIYEMVINTDPCPWTLYQPHKQLRLQLPSPTRADPLGRRRRRMHDRYLGQR